MASLHCLGADLWLTRLRFAVWRGGCCSFVSMPAGPHGFEAPSSSALRWGWYMRVAGRRRVSYPTRREAGDMVLAPGRGCGVSAEACSWRGFQLVDVVGSREGWGLCGV
jgi:hypothetical protein